MMTSDWLTSRVQASPQKTALIMGEQRWTYAELDPIVNGVCARLTDAGVKPGEFVGVLLPNGLAHVCLIHALARLGAVLVPLNLRLTAAELQWQIEHVGCKLVLGAEETKKEWLMVNFQWLFEREQPVWGLAFLCVGDEGGTAVYPKMCLENSIDQ